MQIAVVGNGPSAAGTGKQIDACDFVVRIKAFWEFGAEDTGKAMDAWAWYGGAVRDVPTASEYWITQAVHEFERRERTHKDGVSRLVRIAETAGESPVHFIRVSAVHDLRTRLGAFASTGLRAIAMALDRNPGELLIAGFDALEDDETDARGGQRRPPCHDMRGEKRLLCELENGQWLGKPCKTRLIWLNRPKQLAPSA